MKSNSSSLRQYDVEEVELTSVLSSKPLIFDFRQQTSYTKNHHSTIHIIFVNETLPVPEGCTINV